MKNEIRVIYPRSKYRLLNQEFRKYIDSILQEFLEYGEVTTQLDFPYTLDTYYEKYAEKNYLSYVFFTSMYTGGAHPNNTIYTISYNQKSNEIITVTDLISKNPNILEILSQESRVILKKYPRFQNLDMLDMLIEGTKPNIENFRNFAFSKDGLIIFFEQYQVAPYSEGSFRVVIPYDKLNIE